MNRRPLRVAFIGGRGVGGAYSGIETYYEEVGSRLAQRGHEVTAYCRSYFTPEVGSYRGIRVRRLPSLRSKHLETMTHSLLSTADSIRHRFDIIQYHAIGSAPLALLPRLWGRTTLVSVRGLDWQRAKWGKGARAFLRLGEWASARCPTATVVVSGALHRHYAKNYGRAPHFIPNAPPPAVPAPARLIRDYGLAKDGFLLFAGRLSPEKGVHTLLEALRPLDSHGKKLVLAGGSSYSDGYIDVLRQAAGEHVLFIGSVGRETMGELYSNCYAYILPSAMEGLSVGLLEALSYGACIVTTDIPENLEVVNSAALTFSPGDVDTLRAHLHSILEGPELVRQYRQSAREHARTLPTWDEIAHRTEVLYYEILGARGTRPDAAGQPARTRRRSE